MRETNSERSTNPFSTAFIRPGAIPYQFPENESLDDLFHRFELAEHRGEIIGPHGTGKSTLIAAFSEYLQDQQLTTYLVTLHDGQRRLPFSPNRLEQPEGSIIVVDGFEQLSWWNRQILFRVCRQKKWGILVTAHTPTGLPTLFETAMSPALGMRVVLQLLDQTRHPLTDSVVTPQQALTQLREHDGNLRETLFDLYDRWEAAQHEPPAPSK